MSINDFKWSLGLSVLALLAGCGGDADAGFGAAAGSGNSAGAKSSAGAGAGCASAGAAGGSGGTAGFSGSSVISSLSASDSAALCSEFAAGPALRVGLELTCLRNALLEAAIAAPKTDAEARTKCSASYDPCLETVVPPIPCPYEPTCSATVSEFRACASGALTALTTVRDQLPKCNEVTLDRLTTIDFDAEPADPASCATFEAKCPSPKP